MFTDQLAETRLIVNDQDLSPSTQSPSSKIDFISIISYSKNKKKL